MNNGAAILLSGGMDSSALCAWKQPDVAIFLSYGQRCADAEYQASKQVCEELGIAFEPVSLECADLGSGDLAGRPALSIAPASDWWPFRNQILISAAAAKAVTLGLQTLMIGTVQSDASHADGTPGFIEMMDKLLQMQEGGLALQAPAMHMSSVDLVRSSGIDLPVLCWTHSCHRSNFACGQCRGCNKHREVMSGLGYEAY